MKDETKLMDQDILSGNSSNYHKRLKYIHVKN